MMFAQQLVFIGLGLILTLSIKSAVVLQTRAPLTLLGWIFSALYCLAAFVEFGLTASNPHAPLGPPSQLFRSAQIISLASVALLVLAFVIAGIRDERQAEPWYWPVRLGRTRAESAHENR